MSNGQQWGTVVGGVIGFFAGGNVALGMSIGGMIGGAIDPERIHLPSIGDAQQQTAMAGVPRPVVYGHPAPFAGNIIDGEGKARKIRVKDKGKGGPTVYSEKFLFTYAVRICEGPIAGVLRIWRNGEVVYDARTLEELQSVYDPNGDGGVLEQFMAFRAKSAMFQNRLRIYLGDEDQLPDPALEAIHGVGNTPYYRGTAYMVIEDDDVTQMGGAAAQYQFEVSATCATSEVSAGSVTMFAAPTSGTGVLLTGETPLAWPTTSDAGNAAGFVEARNGRIFAINSDGTGGRVSADRGTTWVDMTGLPGLAPRALLFSEDTWILVVASSSNIYVSTDGVNFTARAYGAAQVPWSAFATGLTVIIAPGNSAPARRSTNGGLTFADVPTLASSTQIWAIAGESILVAVSGNGLVFRSADLGAAWTSSVPTFSDGSKPASVAFGNGLFVAVSSTARTITSPDGITWTAGGDAGTSMGGIGPSNELMFAHDLFVAASDTGINTSPDGIAWTLRQATAVKSMTVLGQTGIELPDAPGYYVEADGTITGPASEQVSDCANVTLRSVVEDIASRCNVPAGKLDATVLTDIIPGYLIAGQVTGADALRPTQQMFFYDLPEVDGPIVAVKRGGAIAATITDDDLLASSDDEEMTRPQQIEYPAKVSVVTQDPAAEYSPVPQTSIRSSINVNSTSEMTVQSPIPFSGDVAAQKAHIIHKVLFARAEGSKDFALPEEYSYLVPSDCIAHEGTRWLIEAKRSADGENVFECVYDRASAYESTATGSAVTPPTLPGAGLRGPTVMVAMNLPQLRTADSTSGMYVAVHGLLSDWAGCTLYLSVDGGETEQAIRPIYNAATMGTLAADFAVAGTTLAVDVRGELESVSILQLAARANVFAIVSGGVAEIGQFQTATLTASGVTDAYDLTDFARGLLETAEATHLTGDRFVLLDSSVYFVPIDATHAGKTLIFRAVTLGTDPANNATFSVVYSPADIIIDGGGA